MPEEQPPPSPEGNFATINYDFHPASAESGVQTRFLYEFLLKIADVVTASREKGDVFVELAPMLQKLMDCHLVVFSVYDDRQECFRRQFWKKSGESGELKPRTTVDGVTAWVWSNQRVLAIASLADEQHYAEDRDELRAHGVESFAALPMSTSLRQYGVLGLGKDRVQTAGPEELEFLSRVARMTSLALENQENTRLWREQQGRVQRLANLSQELGGSLEMESLLLTIFRHIREITDYDYAVLGLLEEGGTTVDAQATDRPRWSQPFPERVPLEQSTSGFAIRSRSIAFLNEDDLRRIEGPNSAMLLQGGIHSVCSIPLLSKDQAVGALNLGKREKNGFLREDAAYLQEIASRIGPALENAKAYREIAVLKDRLSQEKRFLESELQSEITWDEMVGTSPGLKRVLEAASVVARTDATVLITGETGTGKERVARTIHAMSGRKDRSFIKLNCAAIPTGLLESELFGHEKGAFTGAVNQKVGRLEMADKGTLFLDEIGDIALELQPKLLRVLQDYEFERLGGTRTIHVNVRLITATNRDLGRAVEEKQFRRDLFYRLHVFPIHLPALRERRGDIPLLVRHFVKTCGARLRKQIDIVPDQAIEVMMRWHWPGNIRELENFVERSVILSQGNVLRAPLGELEVSAQQMESPDETLRSRERDHIIQVLRQTQGMLSGPAGAAARLGLKRTTLQYRMQKLGISRVDYLD